MNGDEEAFRLIMSTPSDQVRVLTYAEMQQFGLAGNDPAWEEFTEAQAVKLWAPEIRGRQGMSSRKQTSRGLRKGSFRQIPDQTVDQLAEVEAVGKNVTQFKTSRKP
jgi:hypothetical protein